MERIFVANIDLDSMQIIPKDINGKIINGLGENSRLSIGKINTKIINKKDMLVIYAGKL